MLDIAIIGGGPAGLAAALQAGRARRTVAVFDAGTPRNALAHTVNGYFTRDKTPPSEMRAFGRKDLEKYPTVAHRSEWVKAITPHATHVTLDLGSEQLDARHVLLATGMIDELPDLPGYREAWGHSIYQCPYCHGWENQDQAWGYLVRQEQMVGWPLLLRAWTSHVTVFTNGFAIPPELRAKFAAGKIEVIESPVTALHQSGGKLFAVEVADGTRVARNVLFAHPPQRLPEVVRALDLELNPMGFVKVTEMALTSRPRIRAAGDLVTPGQSAQLAAASGSFAGAAINHELMME